MDNPWEVEISQKEKKKRKKRRKRKKRKKGENLLPFFFLLSGLQTDAFIIAVCSHSGRYSASRAISYLSAATAGDSVGLHQGKHVCRHRARDYLLRGNKNPEDTAQKRRL